MYNLSTLYHYIDMGLGLLGSSFFVGASFCSNFTIDCDINSTTVDVFFCFFCGWVWSLALVCT